MSFVLEATPFCLTSLSTDCTPPKPKAQRPPTATPGLPNLAHLRSSEFRRVRFDLPGKIKHHSHVAVAQNSRAGANRRCWSMLPLTRVPCWYRCFEPYPCRSSSLCVVGLLVCLLVQNKMDTLKIHIHLMLVCLGVHYTQWTTALPNMDAHKADCRKESRLPKGAP